MPKARKTTMGDVYSSQSNSPEAEQAEPPNLDLFASLPISITARIISFTISSTVDIASLSTISLSFKRMVLSHIKCCHVIQCPTRDRSFHKSYIRELLAAEDGMYEVYNFSRGDTFDATRVRHRILDGEGVRFESFMAVYSDRPRIEKYSNNSRSMAELVEVDDETKLSLVQCIRNAISSIKGAKSLNELKYLATRANLNRSDQLNGSDNFPISGLFLPINNPERYAWKGIKYYSTSLMVVTFQIDESADCVVAVNETGGYLELKTSAGPFDFQRDRFAFATYCPTGIYIAPIIETIQSETELEAKSYRVRFLIEILADPDNVSDAVLRNIPISSISFDQLEVRQNRICPVEGVVIVDGAVGCDLIEQLSSYVNALARHQEQTNCVDYHPNSNAIVRDLVHPGLYSYVKNVSKLRASVDDIAPAQIPGSGDMLQTDSRKDFWGRQYEDSVYQWLPTYLNISTDGHCTIEDYINNLVPREHAVNSNVHESLARLFERFLPYIESVYSYVCAIRPMLRSSGGDVEWRDGDFEEIEIKPVTLRGNRLQVITKIVDYELHQGQSHKGVWHVEGMSHEEIVLTALYILDRDESITGGDLLFKRAFFHDEAESVFSRVSQMRSTILEKHIADGLTKLGKVETPKGRLIVFPNSHVHKVTKMLNNLPEVASEADAPINKRRIVVFFLVNPLKRIVSTREVAPQQGTMSHEDALNHRLELMKERKFHKQDWNVRTIELCEH